MKVLKIAGIVVVSLFILWIGLIHLVSHPKINPNQNFEFLLNDKIWFDRKHYGR